MHYTIATNVQGVGIGEPFQLLVGSGSKAVLQPSPESLILQKTFDTPPNSIFPGYWLSFTDITCILRTVFTAVLSKV